MVYFRKMQKAQVLNSGIKRNQSFSSKKILSYSPRDEEEEDDDDDDFGIKKRYFYEYNKDAALVRVIVL